MKITKQQLEVARKNGCGEFTIGRISYANFGSSELNITYPKRKKDGILILSKHVDNWKEKTLKEINKEIKEQDWD